MKSAAPNTNDEIEVKSVDTSHGTWGYISIRQCCDEPPTADILRASICLGPDQLEEHAHICLALAANLKRRANPQSFFELASRVIRSKIKITITKIFDVEFDDAPAASRMFMTLEAERQAAILTAATGNGWKIQLADERHTVEPIRETPK